MKLGVFLRGSDVFEDQLLLEAERSELQDFTRVECRAVCRRSHTDLQEQTCSGRMCHDCAQWLLGNPETDLADDQKHAGGRGAG